MKPILDHTEIAYLPNEIPNCQLDQRTIMWELNYIYTLKWPETVFNIPPDSIKFSKII